MPKRSNQSVPSVETGATKGDFNRSQSIQWKNKSGRNATTDEARRGAGQVAPRPQASKQGFLASSSATSPTQGGMVRVKDARSSPTGKSGPAGSFTPVQNNANANLNGEPNAYGGSGTPPAPRGGPPGIRAGGRNQGWPNGAMYTDAVKRGGHARQSNAISTTKSPTRKIKGAAFYGEY